VAELESGKLPTRRGDSTYPLRSFRALPTAGTGTRPKCSATHDFVNILGSLRRGGVCPRSPLARVRVVGPNTCHRPARDPPLSWRDNGREGFGCLDCVTHLGNCNRLLDPSEQVVVRRLAAFLRLMSPSPRVGEGKAARSSSGPAVTSTESDADRAKLAKARRPWAWSPRGQSAETGRARPWA
jgi:hypothetical protein